MADDVAVLGLEVESAPVTKAHGEMDKLSSSAKELQKSVKGLKEENVQFNEGQKKVIDQIATMIGKTQFHGRELAQFMALRRAATSADTVQGQVIMRLAGAQYDLERAETRRAGVTERVTSLVMRQVAALGALIAAQYSLHAIREAVDQVGRIGDIAERLHISSELLQVFRLQVELAGGTAKEADIALDRFARTVGEAATGQGYFIKFLRQNNVELRDQNGRVRDLNELYVDTLRLMAGIKDSTQQVSVTQRIFGVGSREVAAVMKGGPEALKKLYDEMIEKGQILGDSTIHEAQRMNEAWVKLMDRLDKGFKKSVIETVHWVEELGAAINRLVTGGGKTTMGEIFQGMYADMGEPPENSVAGIIKKAEKIQTSQSAALNSRIDSAFGALLLRQSMGTSNKETVVPKIRDDQLDKMLRSVRKNIVEMTAEAEAAGSGAAAIGELQKRQLLLNQADEYNIELTRAKRKEIDMLAAAYGKAAEQVARMKVVTDAQFERKTLMLTDTEAKVAQTLRPVFGNNVEAALKSSEASMLRINEQLRIGRELVTEFATGFTRDFKAGIQQGMSAWDSFAKAGLNALNRLADRLMDIAISNLAQKAFGGLLGGIGTISTGQVSASGLGLVGVAPFAPVMHGGGVVGSRGLSGRYVHPAYFENAPRYHNGIDFVGGERPAILKVGERVIPAGQNTQEMNVNVNINISGYQSKEDVAMIAKAAAAKGVQEAIAITNAAAPGRTARLNLLGT